MRPTLIALAVLSLAACGGDSSMSDAGSDASRDARAPDLGPAGCTSDGTPLGDCMQYDCLIRQESQVLCGRPDAVVFNGCSMIPMFPADYQTTIQAYFHACAAAWPTIMAADVPVGMGMTAHINTCQILDCARKPNTQREYMCMAGTMDANCVPVPMDCNFPDPPGFVCQP